MAAERAPSSSPSPSPPAVCPSCAATSARAASLTERFVYLRCSACGEVWCIPERRTTGRVPVTRPSN